MCSSSGGGGGAWEGSLSIKLIFPSACTASDQSSACTSIFDNSPVSECMFQRQSLHTSHVAYLPGAYPGFCSMK